ncbi:MAG: hypothetical protein ACXWL2_04940 [Candidatus Chromulinivorax sp.]
MKSQLKSLCIIVLSINYAQSSDLLKNLKKFELEQKKIELLTQAQKNPTILQKTQFEKEIFYIQEYDDDDDEWYLKRKCTKKEIKENIQSCIQDHTEFAKEYRQNILKNSYVQKNLRQSFPGLYKTTPSKFLYPNSNNDPYKNYIIKICTACLVGIVCINIIFDSPFKK